jgi:hypothetical protein
MCSIIRSTIQPRWTFIASAKSGDRGDLSSGRERQGYS